jgi:hypothetical protein
MTCQQCLAELATGSLRDLQPESAVMQHCATCPDCAPLATQLRDREYNAATILNNLPPMSNPIAIAETAGLVSQRRRVGKVVVFLSGAALVATIVTSIFVTDLGRRAVGANAPALFTETISLTCLSPEQAGDIISPYLRSPGSLYYTSRHGIPVITVRGTEAQIAKSKHLISEFEADPRMCAHNSVRIRTADPENGVRKTTADDPNPEPVLAPTRPKK